MISGISEKVAQWDEIMTWRHQAASPLRQLDNAPRALTHDLCWPDAKLDLGFVIIRLLQSASSNTRQVH